MKSSLRRLTSMARRRGAFAKYPINLKSYIRALKSIDDSQFSRLVKYVESKIHSEELTTRDKLKESDENVAKSLGVDVTRVSSAGILYGELMDVFASEDSRERFVDSVSDLGLNRKRAELLWENYESHKGDIENLVGNDVRSRVAPNIVDVVWRVDIPYAWSGNIDMSKPVAAVGLKINDGDDDTHLTRFQVDELSLDYLIEELQKLQESLSEASLKQAKK